ncbi:MAG: NUDIX domain-containing protein [Treponema sp.]|nr:NUDIX domain-containing protein [Treponema sp.]
MQRSVAGIAWGGGKFFIAQRLAGGDMGEKWEFPGGKVDGAESDQEALKREYREEFGVDVSVGEFLGSAVFEHRGVARRVRAYRVFFAAHDFVLTEHTRWSWASLEEIEQLDFVDSDRKLLPALKNRFGAKHM